jgi:hypothetical protein
MTDVEKNTYQDKRDILSKAVRSSTGYSDSYTLDFDDSYVYFEKYETNGYQSYKSKYTYDGTSASLSGEITKVVKTTQYKDVVEKSLEERVLDVIKSCFGGTNRVPVIKQFQDEKMIAVEPLYICANEVDGQGDTIDRENLEYLVKSLNDNLDKVQPNMFHKVNTPEAFKINKAWINPYPCKFSEGGIEVPEGQPLVEIQFLNEVAWDLRKSGELMGLSIGARAEVEEVK